MLKPKWLYSWTWTEADEIRLSNAANELDSLANEISSLAELCYNQGKNSLSVDLISDAGIHYEDELSIWKQKINSEVVYNLRLSASAIRNTIAERQTIWDQFQSEMGKFNKWLNEQTKSIVK